MSSARVLILGASGRLGQMLQRHWPARGPTPLWHYRSLPAPPGSLIGDPFDTAALAQSCGAVDVVLGLAGVVPGRGDLDLNTGLALTTLDLAAATGAGHVFLASSAAVYGASDQPIPEDTPLRPQSPYGAAKARMEHAASAHATRLKLGLTHLRIGNVAGADALLAQPGARRKLDRFPDGQGPRRSYISAQVLAEVLAGLAQRAAPNAPLPETLNIAQPPAMAMSDLCQAAGFTVTWQPAPATALPAVELDLTRLMDLLPVPQTSPSRLVTDWRSDQGAS